MYWFVYFFQPVLCSFVLFEKWTWPIDGIDKKCASNLALDSPQEQYAKLVTPYVLSFIVKWLSLCDRVTFSEDFTTGCTVESSEGSLSVSSQECHCTFWKNMKVPCWHIFAYQDLRDLPLFLLKVLTNVGWCLTSEVHYNKKEYASRWLKVFSGTCRYNYLNDILILYNVHPLD